MLLASASPLFGQVEWRDLVITGGMSGEGYQGKLPSAGSALQDSTQTASALVGELGIRGDGAWSRAGSTRATLFVDGGLRQFSARGFQQRDYAPREWVGEFEGAAYQALGDRYLLSAFAGVRGRAVQDRTPMPLFLQPGYVALSGGTSLRATPGGWDWVDLTVSGEKVDFAAPDFAPQIRLLDRELMTVQVSASRPVDARQGMEAYLAVDLSRFQGQSTFDTADPYRRDRTYRGRVGWNYQGSVLARTGVEGRLNRSNSRRPEYGSVTLDGQLSAVLPGSSVATAYVVITAKRYRESIPFARLLPGEEANSASTAYVSLSRQMARNLDGAFRVGWTRAEAETGDDYFQRLGLSFLLTYRPGG
ncbi:MAG: hypothetical protein EA350_13665 [Gemmatimonadales bacterium]|nr:MAG: hypothetical protein EA350_13665 [Gemmatimonadales bacterium]